MGGLRDSYCGRQRLCVKCGTIYRMGEPTYYSMVGIAVMLFAAGVVAFYWKFKALQADLLTLGWLIVWLVLFWPLLYYCVWRAWVKMTK